MFNKEPEEELTELRKEELRVSAEMLRKLDPKDRPPDLKFYDRGVPPVLEQLQPTSVMGQRPSTVVDEIEAPEPEGDFEVR